MRIRDEGSCRSHPRGSSQVSVFRVLTLGANGSGCATGGGVFGVFGAAGVAAGAGCGLLAGSCGARSQAGASETNASEARARIDRRSIRVVYRIRNVSGAIQYTAFP
jgi:hypothetical protein